MTCRVSLIQDKRSQAAVSCADCGARDLEDFYTSKEQNAHLCSACYQARIVRGTTKEAESGRGGNWIGQGGNAAFPLSLQWDSLSYSFPALREI